MGKIILPLVYVAMLYFLPLFSVTSSDNYFGVSDQSISGSKFLSPTVDCVIEGVYTIEGDCAPLNDKDGGYMGYVFLIAVAFHLVASALSVFGLVPIVGRFTSIFVVLAGFVGLFPVFLVFSQNYLAESPFVSIEPWFYGTGVVSFFVFLAGFSSSKKRGYR